MGLVGFAGAQVCHFNSLEKLASKAKNDVCLGIRMPVV